MLSAFAKTGFQIDADWMMISANRIDFCWKSAYQDLGSKHHFQNPPRKRSLKNARQNKKAFAEQNCSIWNVRFTMFAKNFRCKLFLMNHGRESECPTFWDF